MVLNYLSTVFNDMVLHAKLDAPTFTNTESQAANTPTIRWCDYPGERLLQKVAFEVNGNPLDSYTQDAVVMHRNFLVQPNKRLAWDRCVGQQVSRKGYMTPDAGTPDGHQVAVEINDGAQTPKTQADNLSMFIPLLFWCN